MGFADRTQVLADIQAGKVTRTAHDVYNVPDNIPTDELGDYRTRVHMLVLADAVMPSGRYTDKGASILRLTTLGQGWLLADNPNRYTSATAIEVRDGKVEARQVTS